MKRKSMSNRDLKREAKDLIRTKEYKHLTLDEAINKIRFWNTYIPIPKRPMVIRISQCKRWWELETMTMLFAKPCSKRICRNKHVFVLLDAQKHPGAYRRTFYFEDDEDEHYWCKWAVSKLPKVTGDDIWK
jgi:hypothetical protein